MNKSINVISKIEYFFSNNLYFYFHNLKEYNNEIVY